MSTEEEVLSIAERFLNRVSRSGSDNIKASCPFHTSDNPGGSTTFYMSLTTGLWVCHSCKEKGNLPQFLKSMGVTGLAIKQEYGGLVSSLHSPEAKTAVRKPRAKVDVEPLPESLLGVFDKCPLDLVKEGFLEETLRDFDVGFDDRHMRITFPLRDLAGNLVGFSGRTVVDAPTRYKIYDAEYKQWGLPMRPAVADVLWNGHRVYPEVYFGKDIPLVVVEGFKGCMWVHQAGIKNVVALIGSILKPTQKWTLEHLGGVVYLMMDNDDSGRKATHEIGAALSKSLKVKIMTFRQAAKQPTDLEPREVTEAFENATEFYRWSLQQKGK